MEKEQNGDLRKAIWNFALMDKVKNKTNFGKAIRPFLSTYFSDINEDLRMLDQAFCKDMLRHNHENSLSSYLEKLNEAAALLRTDIEQIQADEKDPERIDSLEREILKYELERKDKTIFLLGKIGAGKSTFINRFFKISLKKRNLHDKIIHIYVDLLAGSPDFKALEKEVELRVLDFLHENYNHLKLFEWETELEIFSDKINKWKKGSLKPIYENKPGKFEETIADKIEEIKKDKGLHIKFIFQYLIKAKNCIPCIIIDNTDQFDVELQKNVIWLAFHKAEWTKGVIVVNLRGGTFLSLHDEILNSYKDIYSKIYEFEPPRFCSILNSRIDYLFSRLEDSKLTFEEGDLKITIENLKDFLSVIFNTLIDIKDREHFSFNSLSNLNVRESLAYLRDILTSGHVPVFDFIVLYKSNDRTFIPYHYIIKAIMLGDFRYYKESRSFVKNIFDIGDRYQNISILLPYRILSYLAKNTRISPKRMIRAKYLLDDFSDIGYDRKQTAYILERLFKKGLFYTWQFRNDSIIEEKDDLYISHRGKYYYEYLIYKFEYIQNVIEDTLLPGNLNIFLIEEEDDLQLKIRHVKAFFDYLKKIEDGENNVLSHNPKYDFKEDVLTNKMSREISNSLTNISHRYNLRNVNLSWFQPKGN